MTHWTNPNGYKRESPCCPGAPRTKSAAFWPSLFTDEKATKQTTELILKVVEEKIKVCSIHFKLSKKTEKLSAFQIQYSHGVQTTMMKAKDETDDDMQIVTLKKKQFIAKLFYKRIDRTTMEFQYFD